MFNKSNPARGGVGIFGIGLTVLSLFVSIALIGCDNDALTDDAVSPSFDAGFSKNNGSTLSTRSSIYSFDGLDEVGSSILKRFPNEVSASFSTSDLIPGDTYTLWLVIFDEPQNCTPHEDDPSETPACSEDDVFGPMAGAPDLAKVSVLWGGDGAVAPQWGRKNFRGTVAQYDASGSVFGDGLDNPETAEIHQVLRSHGAAIQGLVREQITTFNGGCDPGQPNEGECFDMLFSIHKAN